MPSAPLMPSCEGLLVDFCNLRVTVWLESHDHAILRRARLRLGANGQVVTLILMNAIGEDPPLVVRGYAPSPATRAEAEVATEVARELHGEQLHLPARGGPPVGGGLHNRPAATRGHFMPERTRHRTASASWSESAGIAPTEAAPSSSAPAAGAGSAAASAAGEGSAPVEPDLEAVAPDEAATLAWLRPPPASASGHDRGHMVNRSADAPPASANCAGHL